jgi:hypothetical protein
MKTEMRLRLVLGTALLGLGATTAADQVILDDLIVNGSTCVGVDCVNGENFGFDTIRLKENNLRIKFQDTSNSASFPTNDWQIIANDSSNGGASYLGIEDVDGGRIPFRVEAGARSNALVVESDGDIGIGTLNPTVDVHVVTGNTPTLRLAQDGSSGFTAQTWDIAGNETNFFVRDVTNGSKLSFRIKPGAPDASIYIDSTGEIGMGAGTNPLAPLHVRRTDDTARIFVQDSGGPTGPQTLFELENNGNPEFQLTNSSNGNSWLLSAGVRFVFKNNAGDAVMRLTDTGDLELLGTVLPLSDVNAKTDIVSINPESVLGKVVQLPISEWAYKANPDARHIGPMAQDFRAAFGTGSDDKRLATMDAVGVAIASIQALEARNRELESRIAKLESIERENSELKERLTLVEAMITQLLPQTAQR